MLEIKKNILGVSEDYIESVKEFEKTLAKETKPPTEPLEQQREKPKFFFFFWW